ncbi:hypothetical protein GG344DRAFT_73716 [Lentinula edodes]|nr:hypothetical protein GG344DRAFT_73716 [Lentinula edodes]
MPTTPITPLLRGSSPSYHDLYSKPLIDCNNQSYFPNTSDECELKDFFFGLYSFKPSPDEPLSPLSSEDTESLSSGSTIGSDEQDIENVFALDKDSYDFKSQLPPCAVISIQEMLDTPDIYDSQFRDNYKHLNPQAAPFVPSIQSAGPSTRLPSIIRARVLAASASDSIPLLPPPPPNPLKAIPAWMIILHLASTTTPADSFILAARARELAHSHFWHPEALAELAQHFCWNASDVNADIDRETMAAFAREVSQALRDAFDEDTADSFVWHLRESLIGTFKGCWCATESSKAISYRFAPSEEYVASATRLVAFIGDLFTLGLIRVQHIKMCLNILVHELTSLEHITAISVLIDHAGPRFWCRPGSTLITSSVVTREPSREMIDLFLMNFLPKTTMLQNGSSVLARTVVAGSDEKDRKVQEILDIVAQWCPDIRISS